VPHGVPATPGSKQNASSGGGGLQNRDAKDTATAFQ
jgi:hypothetical protein